MTRRVQVGLEVLQALELAGHQLARPGCRCARRRPRRRRPRRRSRRRRRSPPRRAARRAASICVLELAPRPRRPRRRRRPASPRQPVELGLQPRRVVGAAGAQPHPRGRLVDEVDRLVGQAVLGDVAVATAAPRRRAPRRRSPRRGAPRRRSRRPRRISTVSSTDGSSTVTGEKRRASAPSRSILRNSASVVAPTMRSSPRASIGLSMFAASIAPSAPPAPRIVCSSSTNSTTRPSASATSSSTAFRRCSNWPRNCAPATMPARSSATSAAPRSVSGTSPAAMREREALDDRGLADAGARRSARRCSCAGGRGSRRSARSRRRGR